MPRTRAATPATARRAAPLVLALLALPVPAGPDAPEPRASAAERQVTLAREEAAIASADPRKGKVLYGKYCKLCHADGGAGYAADHANALANPDFLASANDAFLALAIDQGRPGTPMAAFGWRFGGPLQIEELFHLLAYLRSLYSGPRVDVDGKEVRGDAAAGAAVYRQQCARCHGAEGQGGSAVSLDNPVFHSTASDGYIRYAVKQGRRGTAMPAFAGSLSAQAIDDVSRFLRSLARTTKVGEPVGEVPPSFEHLVAHPNGPAAHFPPLRKGRYLPAVAVSMALAAEARMVLLDARPTSDWLRTHIPGALPVPYYGDDKIIDKLPRDGTWIIAYCGCPHAASDEVMDRLRAKGFKRTAVLDEGFLVWMQRRYPVTFGNAP